MQDELLMSTKAEKVQGRKALATPSTDSLMTIGTKPNQNQTKKGAQVNSLTYLLTDVISITGQKRSGAILGVEAWRETTTLLAFFEIKKT
jgi:hypothetical protein